MEEGKKKCEYYYSQAYIDAINSAKILKSISIAEIIITCPMCKSRRLIGKALQGIGLLQQPCKSCANKMSKTRQDQIADAKIKKESTNKK
jgi:transposase-like protein